jgi:hypothetical protein
LKLDNVVYSESSVLRNTALVDLSLKRVDASGTLLAISKMAWLNKLKISDEYYYDVGGDVCIDGMSNLSSLTLGSNVLGVENLPSLCRMTRLAKLDVMLRGAMADPVVLPAALEKLSFRGRANLVISGCTSLRKLVIGGAYEFLCGVLSSACGIPTLRDLRIVERDVDVQAMNIVAKMYGLTSLVVPSYSDTLDVLLGLTNLQRLTVCVSEVSNIGCLSMLTSLNHLALDIRSPVDECLRVVARLSSVKSLTVGSPFVRCGSGPIKWLKKMEWLQELCLNGWWYLNGDHFRGIHRMTSLKVLVISSNQLSNAGLEFISGATSLECIDLRTRSNITLDGLRALNSRLPRLRKLRVNEDLLDLWECDDYCRKCERFI